MNTNTVLTIAFVFLFSLTILAQDDLKEENAQLRKRIEKLEVELEKINSRLENNPSSSANSGAITKLEEENKILKDKVQKIETDLEKYKQTSVESQFMIKLYGYVKLDMVYDTARMNSGNIALWVESEEFSEDDDDFHMTVNQTRLGFDFRVPEVLGIQTKGKIEFDFYGGGPENKPRPMLRQAYVEMEWPEWDFGILAGQAWDIVSPLAPDTINFLIQSNAGNIGYRRPQLRLTKGFAFSEKSKLTLQAALARTIGHSNNIYPAYLDSGSDSGFPTVQGRLAVSSPLWTEKAATIGFWGHWGQEEYDIDKYGSHEHFDTWSVGLELTLPIMNKVTLTGEVWMGENLDAYLGGIGQGVNTDKVKEVSSKGCWANLNIGLIEKFNINFGASIEDPQDGDLNQGDRKQNWSIYGNVWYNITEYVLTGIEIGYWKTLYKEQERGESLRVQGAVMFKF